MRRTKGKLSSQMKAHSQKVVKAPPEYDGSNKTISTGSTLLDLAISGGRFRYGGIPLGILVEVFGPASCGKTVMLCELAGRVQGKNGGVLFYDPEARLNKAFARLFNFDVEQADEHYCPNTVTEVFEKVRAWEPKKKNSPVNGIFTDSLAALSTDMEMSKKEGDKMGMRRAKEFSEELRKTCRILSDKEYLMVCSNQIRQNSGASQFEPKYKAPGGEVIGFYASLRLRCFSPSKIKVKKTFRGKEVERVVGVKTEVEVFKSSVWKPFRTAPITIFYDYGIDDIRQNLRFIKQYSSESVYTLGGQKLSNALDESIRIIESGSLQQELREEVVELWNRIERKFTSRREPKKEM